MKTIVKNITTYVILVSLLALLIGIGLITDPGLSLVAIGALVGAYLIVQGIVLVILDVKAWRLFIPFEGMLKGILSIILGFLLLKHPDSLAAYIGVALGIYIIVNSFGGIKLAAALRYTGLPWVLMIILNVFSILLGCLVLYSPVFSALSLTVYIGLVLVVYSVITIVYMLIIKKNAKDVEKIIAEKGKTVEVEAEAE
ncbi:MAG: DUF308 domain-containing protein [Clostridia bacterium]|nr:DUF308 domain-containing protein [Clostridia bacterium]